MGKKSQGRIHIGDAVISVLLASLCIFVLFQSRHYSLEAARLPRAVAASTLFLSGWVLFLYAVICVRARKKKAISSTTSGFFAGAWWKGVAVAGAGFGYAALLRPLGFLISTFAVMVLLPPLLGYRRHWMTVATALVLTLLIYGVFSLFLTIPLPRGLL